MHHLPFSVFKTSNFTKSIFIFKQIPTMLRSEPNNRLANVTYLKNGGKKKGLERLKVFVV